VGVASTVVPFSTGIADSAMAGRVSEIVMTATTTMRIAFGMVFP
jgi:hypothetical protein